MAHESRIKSKYAFVAIDMISSDHYRANVYDDVVEEGSVWCDFATEREALAWSRIQVAVIEELYTAA